MSSRLPRALLQGLIDDAAVFPPGLAPLPRAVSEHLARTAYRPCVGPLLVPATAAADVRELAGQAHLRVGLIARPGMPVEPLREGVAALVGSTVEVAGVEVGAAADWESLVGLGVPVTVEIPRDGFVAALDRVAATSRQTSRNPLVQAKFRTGATEVWAWPDEAELARFLVACLERDLPFKLTGGLHHVVRADHPGPHGPQHGLLNVLAAVHVAAQGAPETVVADLLTQRDAAPLADLLTGLTIEQVGRVRWAFTAYGCCTVLDPLSELAALDLIDKEHE
ncbi:MAG: hypothetical protein IPF90_14385 [Actinomycetales bacterium]|nr:hypothetical protein [Candidatus Phosphoribacter baldrii]